MEDRLTRLMENRRNWKVEWRLRRAPLGRIEAWWGRRRVAWRWRARDVAAFLIGWNGLEESWERSWIHGRRDVGEKCPVSGGGETSIGVKQLRDAGRALGVPLLEVWGSCHVAFYMAPPRPLNCLSCIQFWTLLVLHLLLRNYIYVKHLRNL